MPPPSPLWSSTFTSPPADARVTPSASRGHTIRDGGSSARVHPERPVSAAATGARQGRRRPEHATYTTARRGVNRQLRSAGQAYDQSNMLIVSYCCCGCPLDDGTRKIGWYMVVSDGYWSGLAGTGLVRERESELVS